MLARLQHISLKRCVLVEVSLGTGWTEGQKSILNKKSIEALETREEEAFCLEPRMQMRQDWRGQTMEELWMKGYVMVLLKNHSGESRDVIGMQSD